MKTIFSKVVTILCIILFMINFSITLKAQNKYVELSGKITAKFNNQPLVNCNVFVLAINKGVVTKADGTYLLKLHRGKWKIRFSFIGYKTKFIEVELEKNKVLDIALETELIEQGEVTVTDKKEDISVSVQELEIKDIKKMPTLYSDVLRSVKILPGVTSNNELSSSYNVRGGNYDENLIYLNGYEIYRPFLLKQGIEENQSLINPEMVKNLKFYGGGFPARLGDKMSSALEVNYGNQLNSELNLIAKADLFHSNFTIKKKFGNLNAIVGTRLAYPGLFMGGLQTQGDYKPQFRDVQALLNYNFSENTSVELFFINAYNKFNLVPDNWKGHYKSDVIFDIREIRLNYYGESNYKFNTGLIGLKFNTKLSDKISLTTSVAHYNTEEKQFKNLRGEVYYSENAHNPEQNRIHLKTRYEYSDNFLKLFTTEIKSQMDIRYRKHLFSIGANASLVKLDNKLNEFIYEVGDSSIHDTPIKSEAIQNINFNSYGAFVEDNISINKVLQANIGLRVLRYEYNNETLISPRASLYWYLNSTNIIRASYGNYYQPPFFYELRNKSNLEKPLKSQKSIHYILSWEHKAKEDLIYKAEIYYKKLDDIIPYYIDQLKLEYLNENSHEGFAYGLDFLIKGEISDGLNSWIGYSYMSSKERKKGTDTYQRRLLDQTHTLQIFLQDKMKKSKHIQVHLRFLVGSGFLYHPREIVTNGIDNKKELKINYNRADTFLRYLRADMGLTAKFKLGKDWNVMLVAEVLNVFDNYNTAGYSWYQILPSSKVPVSVAHIYSKRFFNLGFEISL